MVQTQLRRLSDSMSDFTVQTQLHQLFSKRFYDLNSNINFLSRLSGTESGYYSGWLVGSIGARLRIFCPGSWPVYYSWMGKSLVLVEGDGVYRELREQVLI